MSTTYSQSVREQTKDFPLLQEATKLLEEILGDSADLVTAQWDLRQDDKGRPIYWLTLKYSSFEVAGPFTPDEVRSSTWMRFRLYRLWGDLLWKENQPRIERMMSHSVAGQEE